jgi:prepilin-type N-terminal cleavage/methylation domain-containing protein
MKNNKKIARGPASPKTLSRGGYTLIELIVAIGLFALIMMLVSGAYLMMISVTKQAQGIATGIDNLSFALETMTRTIRTGTNYSCNGVGDCFGGSIFSVKNSSGTTMTYSLSGGAIVQNNAALTDPSVNITSLTFYVSGTKTGDAYQPHVTITVSGTVSAGPGKTEPFSIETGATMRGIDI